MDARCASIFGVANQSLVVPYDPRWVDQFRDVGCRLRDELGDLAVRIDHIGSTSVVGLDAKPIVDVQVSVVSLDPVEAYRLPMERCGLVWRPDNPELTKRYFRERPRGRRTHVHVRRIGSFSEQFALLFRDYLRGHPTRAAEYALEKQRLAPLLLMDRPAYVDAKVPFIWATIQLADEWAQSVGWEPGASDA